MAVYVVTGGAGFIGSNLVEALLGRGESVRVLDNFATGRRQNLEHAEQWAQAGGGAFRLVEGDLRKAEDCEEALRGADFVLHQAAIPSVQRSIEDPLGTNQVNVNGTLHLLESARRNDVRRFVFASSSAIYGESPTLPKIETMPSAPISPYGLQKLAGETYCALFHRLYGLPTVALRYFNVFGARQNPGSEYSAAIPRFITSIKQGRRPTIYGDGEQSRDFTYIGNVVHANLRACEVEDSACGATYNIACGERISLNELVRRIGELVGCVVEPEHVEPRTGDIRHSLAGIDEARNRLGYEPSIDLVEGLRRTLETY